MEWSRAGALAVLICVGTPAGASAQDDFSRLKLTPGQIIYVTDTAAGVEVAGPLERLSPSLLCVEGYAFEPTPGLKIERRGDSLWDGAAIGFGVGAFLVYPVVHEAGPAGAFRPRNGLVWAGIGALLDLAHVGRTTIYRGNRHARSDKGWQIVPAVGVRSRGLALAKRFR